MKRQLAIFMAVVMFFSGSYLLPGVTAAEAKVKTKASQTGSWLDYTEEFKTEDVDGTKLGTSEDKPILIESEGQLAYLAKMVNEGTKDNNLSCDKYFKLTKNLDISDHYWTAIGIGGQEFQGYFDGNGKVIQGLNMNERETERSFGLFGDVYAAKKGAGIKNLTILNAKITASCVYKRPKPAGQNSRIRKNGYGGILAASVYGNHSDGSDVKPVIENCQVQGEIVCLSDENLYDDKTRESDAGGIAGRVSYAVIKNCNALNVNINSMGGYVGAFTGLILDNSEVSGCTATGYVAGLGMVGGFTGDIKNGSIVESSIAGATAVAYFWNVGGFCGYAAYLGEDDTQSKIKNCIATGNVYSHSGSYSEPRSGAFVGTNVALIQQCYAAGKVTVDDPENYPSGGFAGINAIPSKDETASSGKIEDCAYYKWDSTINDVYRNESDPDSSISNIMTMDSAQDMTAYIHEKTGGHYGAFCSGIQTAKPCKAGYTGDIICQYDKETVKQGTSYTLHDGLEEHQWDEGVVQVEPANGKEGEVLYTCQVCEETKTVKVSQWPLPAVTPTATPTVVPTPTATATATAAPVVTPTGKPTTKPTVRPTVKPTVKPTKKPATKSTAKPTMKPGRKITAKQQEKNSISLNEKASADWQDGKFNVSWGAVKGASGYDVYAALCTKKMDKKALVKTVTGTKTSAQFDNISGKAISGSKNYKVMIQAFQKVNGKKVLLGKSKIYHIAGWKSKNYTNAKKLIIPKKKITLKKGKTAKCNVKAVKQQKKKKWLSKKHGAVLRYHVTNKNIATVTKTGKIKAKKAGTCVIYVSALNGICGKITVTVK